MVAVLYTIICSNIVDILATNVVYVGCLTLSLPESNLESINVVVSFESVDETLVCDHSNDSY